jgi:hypothetical protein
MATFNVTQTIDLLKNMPVEIAILISGNHGIGKSQIVKQAATQLGVPCVDFRLSQNDVGDLKGMPFHVKGRTVFAIPEFFPLKESDALELKDLLNLTENISIGRYGEKGILFLDEINRANPEVQQAAFELVLDRRLNLRSLPDGWRVVAAINGDDSIYRVNEMEPAFLSRFFLVDFVPTQQEWLRWANDNELHESVIQFITKKPEFLDPHPDAIKEAAKQGVVKLHDRRSWEKFSTTLKKFEKDFEAGNRPMAPLTKNEDAYSFLVLLASGFVGSTAALSFKSFVELDYNALDANTILNKFDKDVKEKLQNIVKIGRIPELAAYNELIISYIAKNKITKFSAKQKSGLTSYVEILPMEMRADLWQKLNQDHKEVSEDWYEDEKPQNLIMAALINPKAGKKAKA